MLTMLRAAALLATSVASTLCLGHDATPASGCRVTQYRPLELPLRPAAINDAGQVAGTTLDSHRAALWTARHGLQELPLPPGFEHSEAIAINGRGHVVGMAYGAGFSTHRPFLFARGVTTLLAGDNAVVFHIDDAGEIAGEALLPGKIRSEPVVWVHGAIQPIETCCGGSAKRINANGDAIGNAYDADGRYYAFLWNRSAGLRRIGPENGYSAAVASNDRGHVVVAESARVFLYADETLTRLILAPKYPTHPHAINHCDMVVGDFGPFSDKARAFAWDSASGFADLNTRIPAESEWTLESATDVNDRGQIVGKADLGDEQDIGFLLIPIEASRGPHPN